MKFHFSHKISITFYNPSSFYKLMSFLCVSGYLREKKHFLGYHGSQKYIAPPAKNARSAPVSIKTQIIIEINFGFKR